MCKSLLELESNGTCLPLPAETAVTLLKEFVLSAGQEKNVLHSVYVLTFVLKRSSFLALIYAK